MISGMVVSGYGGFYQVRRDDCGAVVDCKPRGRLKQSYSKIYPGDRVEISLLPAGDGMIEAIGPRHTRLSRPQLVNFDQLIIVLAWKLPEYDLLLLDRVLVLALEARVRPVICFNKLDLLEEGEAPLFQDIRAVYQAAGFSVLGVSAKDPASIEALKEQLGGGISVLAGPSGAGKSTLLNQLLGEGSAETGVVSDRLRRGRHTTRYARILPLGADAAFGFIADTPGFFALELPQSVTDRDLPGYYPDFQLDEPCRFDGCLHLSEPDCRVKQAVAKGRVDPERYRRYQRLQEEIKTREVVYW